MSNLNSRPGRQTLILRPVDYKRMIDYKPPESVSVTTGARATQKPVHPMGISHYDLAFLQS